MSRTLCVVALTVAAAPMARTQERPGPRPDQPPEIMVTGTGTVTLPPDYAVVQLRVVTRDPQAARAAQENARLMSALRAALRSLLGVPDDSLPTVGYSIDARYERERLEAVGLAVQAARREAEAIARAAGGRLGALVSIMTSGPIAYPVREVAAPRAMALETPIAPPGLEMTATVSARWAFVPQ